MESPVVLDKPTEYHGKKDERGFPFDEEESGAWSSLAARHPDIAARLRQRPATWARKRRPSSQDTTDDFGDAFGFDRFPFDDIPPEFRDSFPSHWAHRFEEPQHQAHQAQQPHTQQHPPPAPPAPASPQPQQSSAATQTEAGPAPHLPQYGLRNTVDLGQRSAADPSVDADDRGQRSVSAPPDARARTGSMSAHEQPEPQPHPHPHPPPAGTVRHIPIFVEGRDEPVINKNVDHGAGKPHYAPPPPPPHVDRDQYFADDSPAFHHPPNFSRAFGTPFNKGFRQGPQPFTQQKAYPQNAYRGASPQRSQSPKRPQQEDHFAKTHQPQQQAPPPQQHKQHPPQQQHHPQQQQHQPQQQHPQEQQPPPQQPHAPSPPPKQQPTSNDPITIILAIQTDVLNLMSEVENFTGTKKDKKYIFLDEMLTRNLIKLDNIETDGKENIRLARKEAIKCIQKCIAVLEAKADSNANTPAAPAHDVDMQASAAADQANGEVEMKEDTKEEAKADTQETKEEQKPQEPHTEEAKPEEAKEVPPPDTRPETRAVLVEKKEQDPEKKSPKKKVVKKRDKSKDNTPKENEKKEEKSESMQVDEKGDQDSQKMEVDAAAASQ